MSMKLPNVKKPCKNCPFRKEANTWQLGRERMTEILDATSFVCHNNTTLQCAGHMLINERDNAFVDMAARLRITLDLSGQEMVFTSRQECIDHHGAGEKRRC